MQSQTRVVEPLLAIAFILGAAIDSQLEQIEVQKKVAFTAGPALRFIGRIANQVHFEKRGRQDRWLAVLFHHITDGVRWRPNDPLIRGLNVDIAAGAFEARMRWLTGRYEIVSLDDVIRPDPTPTNRQKLLICFDDGYASVFELAAPILRALGVPWCLFINPRFVGSSALPVDNLVSYIANVHGIEQLACIAGRPIDMRAFIGEYLSQMPPDQRRNLVEDLAVKLGIDTAALARESRLHLDERQIRLLAESEVEIGNHTFDHIHCRSLDPTTAAAQIEESARVVGRLSGRAVRAFAYPYGSITDAIPVARRAIENSGHRCAFLVHNRANSNGTDRYGLFRVDLGEMDDARAALELEVLPRMRGALARMKTVLGSRP